MINLSVIKIINKSEEKHVDMKKQLIYKYTKQNMIPSWLHL